MNHPTRQRVRACVALAASLLLGMLGLGPARAQAPYPSQMIRLIVPYPAGGATDTLARLYAQKLQASWQQSVVVENRPGAGGTIGANLVAKSAPDGYTVLFSITALIQQQTLMKLPYDPLRDFTPISRFALSSSVLAVSPTLPVKNVNDFVALVKSQPGTHSYGTYGPGTSSHLQGELFNMQAHTDLTHIPYQGAAPLIAAMLGGQLSSAFLDAGSSRQHLSKFRLIGVTGTERISWLPDVPTLKEQGFQSFDPIGWFGILLPPAAPKPIVDKLSAETQRILKLPDVREKIESMGLTPSGESPESFAQVMKNDTEVYARIIRDTHITIN